MKKVIMDNARFMDSDFVRYFFDLLMNGNFPIRKMVKHVRKIIKII